MNDTLDLNLDLEAVESEAPVAAVAAETKKPRERSKKYVASRAQIDRTIEYPLSQALDMVKRVSYSQFPGTITLHVNLKKEIRPVEVSLPHSTGKSVRVAIVDDALLEDLAQEKIEFDVLIATPAHMPKLAKFARLLGPKGLMPNPKNGTVTTDPETKKQALMAGSFLVKPEKKAPLIHVGVGKTSQPTQELLENAEALLKAIGVNNVVKATLAPTMGPGVKVKIEK